MKTPLQHRRWFRFDLMAKRPAFVGLHVRHYLREAMHGYGRPLRWRAEDKMFAKKRKFNRLGWQLHERRKPNWVYRWKGF